VGYKRDRLEVIFDILSIVKNNKNSIKPTPLLRFSNLSFNSFSIYEKDLVIKGFMRLEEDLKGKKYYTLTDKGFNYLNKYSMIKEFISEFDL